jgi:hypothetical protein
MANSNAPFGFQPNKHQAGGCPMRVNAYEIADGYTTSIYSGDLVRSDATAGGITIEAAAADTVTRILGIFIGCQYVTLDGDVKWSQYWPASTALATGTVATALVMDDPALEYVAQITTVAAGDVGAAFDFNAGTGSAVTGRSGAYIDQADTTNPKFRIEGLSEKIDGITMSEYGAFAKVRCRPINHEKGSALTAY